MILRNSKFIPVLTFTFDLFLLNISLYYAHLAIINFQPVIYRTVDFLILFNLSWITFSSVTKYYLLPKPFVLSKSLYNFLATLLYHGIFTFGLIYFIKQNEASAREISLTYLLYMILIVTQRIIIFHSLSVLSKKGFNKRHALIVGDTLIAHKLSAALSKRPEYGYKTIDFITGETIQELAETSLFEKILLINPDEIFVCYKALTPMLLQHLVDLGDKHTISIKLIPDLSIKNRYISIDKFEDLTVLQLSATIQSDFQVAFMKRSFDLFFAMGAIVIGAPLFILLILITKLTSKGPVFFCQQRVGKNQKLFNLYKLRSMLVDAEKAGPQLSSSNDSRITKWGKIIRKSRLDELPQFWNVLKGDMSVVGPRPEREFFMEQILIKSPNYKKLLSLKPGLTSIGQVNYGYAENVEQMCERVRYDLIYIDNMSLQCDLWLIFKTLKVMTQLKGK